MYTCARLVWVEIYTHSNKVKWKSRVFVLFIRIFRYRMIEYMGRKNYYLKHKGDMNLSPVEQWRGIAVVKELGVSLDEYFDGYVMDYNWD